MYYSILKGLSEKFSKVTVELKNDIEINGNLSSVDNNLNLGLSNITVNEAEKYPQFANMKSCFIRGNIIRYIHFNKMEVDYELIEEACRKENSTEK
ncbi:MAG: U6 snRNA-associated Sm-like protein LSm2 [archaeon]|nr:U6 snRNA-associated Sm-like protein LSm2 [archaeon]